MILNTKISIYNTINYQINNNEYIFINHFFPKKYLGKGFIYQKFNHQKLIHTIISDSILWNNKKKEYLLLNYQERYCYNNQEIFNQGMMLKYNFLIHPQQFVYENFLPENLNTDELKDFIKYEKKKGRINLNIYLNELYQRYNFPCSALILTILAFLLSSNKDYSNNIGKNIVLGIIIAFFYLFFIELLKNISINEDNLYIFIIFIPNIIFLLIVLVFLLIKNYQI